MSHEKQTEHPPMNETETLIMNLSKALHAFISKPGKSREEAIALTNIDTGMLWLGRHNIVRRMSDAAAAKAKLNQTEKEDNKNENSTTNHTAN